MTCARKPNGCAPARIDCGRRAIVMTSMKAEARPSVSRVPYSIGDAVRKPAEKVRSAVDGTAEFLGSGGPLLFGQGTIATALALTLGVLCLLAVLAFHFP